MGIVRASRLRHALLDPPSDWERRFGQPLRIEPHYNRPPIASVRLGGVACDFGRNDFGDSLRACGQTGVLFAKCDPNLACDGVWPGVGAPAAQVVVDSPSQSGDGHYEAGKRDWVEVPVGAARGVASGKGSFDFRGEIRIEVGGKDDGGSAGGLRGGVVHGWLLSS